MSILTGSDNFTYNGFTFPGGTATELTVSPVMDAAERTVKYSVVTISATWYMSHTSASAHESAMTDMIYRLQHQGADYVYNGHGMGPVLSTMNLKDVIWGPRVGDVKIRTLGPVAAFCQWQLKVAYPMCADARGSGFAMDYSYDVRFSYDEAGYTTRVITCELEMPITRVGGSRRPIYTADEFYEKIVPAEIPGFTRTKERSISADKRKMRCTFTDEEQKDTPPMNIAAAEGSFRIQSFPRNSKRYTSSLNCSYTLAKSTPRQVAVDAFVQLLLSRTKVAPKDSIIFVSFSADEGLYRNADKVSFSAQWIISSTLETCIKDSGMFTPIPNTSWYSWRNSTWNLRSLGPRGSAGLAVNAADDAIIDLCAGPIPTANAPATTFTPRQKGKGGIQILTNVRPENSWLEYICYLQINVISNTVMLKSITPGALDPKPAFGVGLGGVLGGITGANSAQSQILPPNKGGVLITNEAQNKPDEVQQRATPTYRVRLWGLAHRARFEISPPYLVSVGGVPVKPVKEEFLTGKLAKYSDIVNCATWVFDYILEERPTKAQVVTPGNPAFQVGDDPTPIQ